MDFLPPDVLINVFGYLGCKERVRLRELSSKFNDLFWHTPKPKTKLIYLYQYSNSFEINIYQNDSIESYLTIRQSENETQHEVISINQSLEDSKTTRDVVMYCNQENFLKTVLFYFKLSAAFIQSDGMCFNNISTSYWSLFNQILKNLPKSNWSYAWIAIQMSEHCQYKGLAETFSFIKNLQHITLIMPTSFNLPIEFFSSKAFLTTTNFHIFFGREHAGYKRDNNLHCENDIGLTNEFVWKLVDRKIRTFFTNAKCYLTTDFFIEYISKCLNGSIQPLYYLVCLFKKEDGYLDRHRVISFVKSLEETDQKDLENCYRINIKATEGMEPYGLYLYIDSDSFTILANCKFYQNSAWFL